MLLIAASADELQNSHAYSNRTTPILIGHFTGAFAFPKLPAARTDRPAATRSSHLHFCWLLSREELRQEAPPELIRIGMII